MGSKDILFVGLERTDNCMVYDISNPKAPIYLQTLKQVMLQKDYYSSFKSPTKRSLLIIGSEGDGTIKNIPA
jgi:hypothetical protein